MGVTVQELNKKYSAEDPKWNFGLFPGWLAKHGIPDTLEAPIVKLTLQQVLAEFSAKTLPRKHHDFDRKVLAMAEENLKKIRESVGDMIEKMLEPKLARYMKTEIVEKPVEVIVERIVEVPIKIEGNRWQKAWRALRGKI